jgi:hypothetical protein
MVAPLGVVSVEVGRTAPLLGDDAGSPLHDLVMHGIGNDSPGCPAPGDVILAPGSSGVVGLRVVRLLLLGPLGSLSQPVD